MDFLGAGVLEHADDLLGGGAAHDGIVDHDYALALDVVAQRVQLEANAHLAHLLRWLDKGAGDVAVLDEALAKLEPKLGGKALRRRQARVGNADDEVGVDGCLTGKLATHVVAHRVHGAAVDDGVGAREVHLFEDAVVRRTCLGAGLGDQAVLGDANDLARFDLAHEASADNVKGAGFRRDDPTRAGSVLASGKLPQNQRPDSVRIPEGIQRVLAGERHGISALDVSALDEVHRVPDALDDAMLVTRKEADELRGHLRVGVGPEAHAHAVELRAEMVGVHQGAIVRKRDNDVVDGGQVRLSRLPAARARSAIANVSDGKLARHSPQIVIREDLGNKTQVLADQHRRAIAHGDARGLLSAMLKGAERKAGESGNVAVGCPNAKDAALLVERVGVFADVKPGKIL